MFGLDRAVRHSKAHFKQRTGCSVSSDLWMRPALDQPSWPSGFLLPSQLSLCLAPQFSCVQPAALLGRDLVPRQHGSHSVPLHILTLISCLWGGRLWRTCLVVATSGRGSVLVSTGTQPPL